MIPEMTNCYRLDFYAVPINDCTEELGIEDNNKLEFTNIVIQVENMQSLINKLNAKDSEYLIKFTPYGTKGAFYIKKKNIINFVQLTTEAMRGYLE